jgi:hypothetical protein
VSLSNRDEKVKGMTFVFFRLTLRQAQGERTKGVEKYGYTAREVHGSRLK